MRDAISFALAVVVVIAVMIVTASAEPCHEQKGAYVAGKTWHWRMIDGRKCWYLSKGQLQKSRLMWPQPEPDEPEPKEHLRCTTIAERHSEECSRQDGFADRWPQLIEFMPSNLWTNPIPLLERDPAVYGSRPIR